MRILVTGAGGFIGSNLQQALIKDERNKIMGLDINPRIKNKNVHCAILPVQQIQKLYPQPEVIYHLAAQSRVQPSYNKPQQTFDDNVAGTQAVLEHARLTGAKVIYAGSSSKHHNPYDSPYAATKMIGEELCKQYRECYGMDIQIARFYNAYGPNEALDPSDGNVIGIWRYNIENNLPLKIVGDGEQRRDFIHVDDIVRGLIRIGVSRIKHDDAWELGTGVNYSINELANMFKAKYDCDIEYIDDQKGNYRATLNTNTDAREQLGWQPQDRLKQYIKSL